MQTHARTHAHQSHTDARPVCQRPALPQRRAIGRCDAGKRKPPEQGPQTLRGGPRFRSVLCSHGPEPPHMVSGRRVVVQPEARPRAGSGVPDRLALDPRKGRLALFQHVLRHASGLEHIEHHRPGRPGRARASKSSRGRRGRVLRVESPALAVAGRVPQWRPRLPPR